MLQICIFRIHSNLLLPGFQQQLQCNEWLHMFRKPNKNVIDRLNNSFLFVFNGHPLMPSTTINNVFAIRLQWSEQLVLEMKMLSIHVHIPNMRWQTIIIIMSVAIYAFSPFLSFLFILLFFYVRRNPSPMAICSSFPFSTNAAICFSPASL